MLSAPRLPFALPPRPKEESCEDDEHHSDRKRGTPPPADVRGPDALHQERYEQERGYPPEEACGIELFVL